MYVHCSKLLSYLMLIEQCSLCTFIVVHNGEGQRSSSTDMGYWSTKQALGEKGGREGEGRGGEERGGEERGEVADFLVVSTFIW